MSTVTIGDKTSRSNKMCLLCAFTDNCFKYLVKLRHKKTYTSLLRSTMVKLFNLCIFCYIAFRIL